MHDGKYDTGFRHPWQRVGARQALQASTVVCVWMQGHGRRTVARMLVRMGFSV